MCGRPTRGPPHPSSSTDEPALFLWKGSEAPPTLRASPTISLGPLPPTWMSFPHPHCTEGPHCLDFSETLVSSRLSSRPASNSLTLSPAKAQEAGSCLAMKTEVRQTMEEETEYGK